MSDAPLGRFERLLQTCKSDRRIALGLMVPNLLGIVYGYYFYYDVGQFPHPNSLVAAYARPWYWWPFIPDSPNAVVLLSASLLLYAFAGKRSRILDNLAFTAMVYVGLWTTFLFLAYAREMHTFDFAQALQGGNANPILFISHMGMPLEALILLPDLRRDRTSWALVGGVTLWNLGNLWLDYAGPHLHPAPFLHSTSTCAGPIPPQPSPCDAVLHAGSPLLLLVVTAVWLAFVAPWRTKTVSS